MKSKATLSGHPLHPMLVSFPIAFYAAAAACFVAYQSISDPFWFQVGYIASIAGVVSAVVAAIPGVIDYAFAIPKDTPAKTTGAFHGLLHTATLFLFGSIIYIYRDVWTKPDNLLLLPSTMSTVVLSVIGVICTIAAGYLGWTLTQTYHMGIDLTPEQTRLEPFRTGVLRP